VELIDVARGHLRVKDGIRSLTIFGEAHLRQRGSPDFVLYRNSIGKWDAPDDREDLTSSEMKEVLQFLQEEFSRRKMLLEIV